MLHLRDNTYHRAPARLIVAIASNTVKSKLFTRGPLPFFLGFGRDLYHGQDCFSEAISKYNPESLLASFTPSTVSGRLKSNPPGEMSFGFQF